MINEQIVEQADRRGLELEGDHEEKFKYYQNLLREKEEKIKEIERRSPEVENDGLIIKYRDV